jgi:hypothetical protein
MQTPRINTTAGCYDDVSRDMVISRSRYHDNVSHDIIITRARYHYIASSARYWGCVFLKNSAPRGRKTVTPERNYSCIIRPV